MFDLLSKHREFQQKYSVWKCVTQSFVFRVYDSFEDLSLDDRMTTKIPKYPSLLGGILVYFFIDENLGTVIK